MAKLNYTQDYNFKRLAKEDEKCWDDVIKRFIDEMVKRGCKTSKEDLEWLLLNYYALPNSPALHTAGDKKFFASACSATAMIDSMNDGEFSILNMIKLNATLTKNGIGTGYSFSNLRSKDEGVRGRKGTTGGPVSFLRGINGLNREITQATRKSASMGLLHINHPDILDFINCKQKDGEISNFNISVIIDDKFMKAVENNEDYELYYRHDDIQPKKIKAVEIFDILAERMIQSAEPGVFFSGNIKRDYFEEINDNQILANPCVIGETEILTDSGFIPIKDCEGKTINVWNGEEFSSVFVTKTGVNQEIIKISLDSGMFLQCTPYHEWEVIERYPNGINKKNKKTKKYKKITKQTKDLRVGDRIYEYDYPVIEIGKKYENPYSLGFYSADGEVDTGVIDVYETKKACIPRLNVKNTGKRQNYKGTEFFRCRLNFKRKFNRDFVPVDGDLKSRLEWLAGFIDGDGCLEENKSIAISAINLEKLQQVQKLLMLCGVKSTIKRVCEEGNRLLPDHKGGKKQYFCKSIYRLRFYAKSIKKLYDLGLRCSRIDLSKVSNKINPPYFSTITYIDKKENQDVFCFKEPKKGRGCFNGIITKQCSEAILTYSDKEDDSFLEMCVLGSINLVKYLKLSVEERRRVVYILTSLLNDVINIQDYTSPLQERGMKFRNRKIGIGVAGLATVFSINGIKYSSDEAYEYTKNVFKEIGQFAKEKSEEIFKIETNINCTCISKNSPLWGLGRFNSSLLSVAPTSSISNIFNDMNEEGCSYSVEPYFSIKPYTVNNSYGVFEKKEKILNIIGEDNINNLIETANDLSWISHIKIVEAYYNSNPVGVVQGLSKTINCKGDITKEDVKQMLMYCWKNKIKAITIYVDGSRKNQVIQTEESYKTSFLVAYKDGAIEQKDSSKVKVLGKNNTIIEKDASGLEKGDIILEEETK